MINKEKILENVKLKISISNFEEEEDIEVNKKSKNIFKIAAVACSLLIITTGITFAKDIEKFIRYYFVDKQITEAAEQGYVEDVDMENIETETTLSNEDEGIILENINVSGKIDEFVMDDINLSVNFSFLFDDRIKESFDLNNLQRIYLSDLVILDNENRIVAANCCKEDFENICKQYNCDYNFDELILEMPMQNCSLISIDKENNLVKWNLNYKAYDKFFPNSKELTFIFTKIRLEKYEEYTGQDINNGEYLKCYSVNLYGDWKMNVQVPEKMYTRDKIDYKVVNEIPEDLKFTYVRLSESGFKVKALISNFKQPDLKNKPLQKEYEKIEELVNNGEITWDEGNKRIAEFYEIEENRIAERKWMRENEVIITGYTYFAEDEEKNIENITHITDSNGKKHEIGDNSISCVDIENNLYEFSADFKLSKYNATDKLTLTLIYYGEPVNVELEQVK